MPDTKLEKAEVRDIRRRAFLVLNPGKAERTTLNVGWARQLQFATPRLQLFPLN